MSLYYQTQFPLHLRELFILSRYRYPRSSIRECFRALLRPTNETLNVWTHLLPFIYFAWRFIVFVQSAPTPIETPFLWPLLIFKATMCIYPLMSAFAHTFNSMSDEARHICFFIDYAALSLYGHAAVIAYSAYVLPFDWLRSGWQSWFIGGSIFVAFFTIRFSCHTRFMLPTFSRQVLRLSAFALTYVYANIPIAYRIFNCEAEKECHTDAIFHWKRQYLLAASMAFFYVSHVPERFFPKRFDFIGHSHQWFHVCGVLGTIDQLCGLLADLREREPLLLREGMPAPTFASTFGCALIVVIINTLSIIYYSSKTYRWKRLHKAMNVCE